ncbi:MAG TPA: hypothetical protein VJ986_14400 [Gaiellaceae bacterium]|nr:hypothetical protein [Gaiellaceae bacterium]
MHPRLNAVTIHGVNLLVLLVGDVPPPRLRAALDAREEPPARVHVVAPMLVRPLDWLATDEDAAHVQAEVRVFEIEWTLSDELDVEGEAGDVDPVQAVEDTLRDFPADEILIAGDAADTDLEDALARFGLPVGRLGRARRRRSPVSRGLRALAAGRNEATPFILFVGVNGALLLVGLLLSAFVLLILWLAGML